MFRQWLKSIERCRVCGFRFDRGEHDYYIGAYTINLIIAELIVVGAAAAVAIVMWPNVPWNKLPFALLAPVIAVPLATYPFSKSLWLGIDLLLRPAESSDFASSSPTPDARP